MAKYYQHDYDRGPFRLPDVTETVHYGHWNHPPTYRYPLGVTETVRVITLPRRGESQASVEQDWYRAQWPTR